MKKTLFFLMIFCLVESVAFSQARIKTANELKLNLLTSLVFAPEIHYERVKSAERLGVISDYLGFGVSAGVTLPLDFTVGSDPEIDYPPQIYMHNYHLISYCRFYFNRRHNLAYHYELKRPQLFFVESNAAVIGFDNRTSFCLGLGLGLKFINSMNYTAEIYAGGGTNLNIYDLEGYYRIGINLGRRF